MKKNRIISAAALALGICMVASVGVFAQTPQYVTPKNPGSYAFDPNPKQVVKIDFGMNNWGSGPWLANECGVNSWWLKNYNIDLTMDLINGTTYDQLLQARIASHTAPDLWVTSNRANIFKYQTQGVTLTPLNTLEKTELPTWSKDLQQENLQTAMDAKGNLVAIPQRGPAMEYVWMFRQDWFTNMGMALPTSFNQIYPDAQKLMAGDPNKDGKKHTVFDDWGGAFFQAVAAEHGIGASASPAVNGCNASWQIINGKLTWDMTTPAMKSTVTWWANAVKAGMFYSDWNVAGVTNDQFNSALINNDYGMCAWTSWWTADPWSTAKKNTPNTPMKWVAVPNLIGTDGVKRAPQVQPNTGQWIVLNKSLGTAANKEKLARTMVFIDQLLPVQNEGNWVTFMGTQKNGTTTLGTKLVMVNGTPTEDQTGSYWFTKNFSFATIRSLDDSVDYIMPGKQVLQAEPDRMALQKPARTQTQGVSTVDAYFDLTATATLAPNLGTYLSTQMMGFLSGKTPMSQWDSFVNTCMTTYKQNQARTIYVKQLQAYGFKVS
jgi:putative aldouronate transport system substrate-binding protein